MMMMMRVMISSRRSSKMGDALQVSSLMEVVIPFILLLTHILHPVGCNTAAVGSGSGSGSPTPQRRMDLICASCRGDNSTCRAVSGIFSRPQLNVGYNLVADIPKGACNLSITEIRKSPNHLALQRRDGSFILNGDWRLSPTGEYYDSGTAFQYKRQDLKTLESVTSPGPVQEAIDLMVLYQQPNPVIKYEYVLAQQSDSAAGLVQDSPGGSSPYLHHLRQPEAATSRPTGYAPFPLAPPKHQQQQLSLLQQPQQHPSLPSQLANNPYNSISSFPTKHHHSLSQFNDGPPTPTGNALYNGEAAAYNNPHYLNSIGNVNGRRNGKIHSGSGSGGAGASSDKKFYWKVTGFTNCTEACGGGVQRPIFRCVRGSAASPVSERRCNADEKPTSQPVRCNVKPCPAEWVIGDWSSCSAECGEGHKTRSIHCQQRVSPTLTMQVAEGACLRQKPQSRISCQHRPCNHWRTSEWSQCSARCGSGIRKRTVLCVGSTGLRLTSQECDEGEKLPELTPCNMGPCEGVDWFASEWSSDCSQKCGTGIQTRNVVCSSLIPLQNQNQLQPYQSYLGYSYAYQNETRKISSSELETNLIQEDDGQLPEVVGTDGYNQVETSGTGLESQPECDESRKPATERECFSERNCGEPIWFTGDWSQCSTKCGSGIRTRQVLCVTFTRGKFKVTSENVCPPHKKPAEREECDSGLKCQQRWFTTEWSECSALCGGGLQKRSVSCRASNMLPSSLCFDKDRPVERQSCNEQKCTLTPITAIPTSASRNSGEMVRDKPVSFRPYSPAALPSSPPFLSSSSSPSPTISGTPTSSYGNPNDLDGDPDDASCTDQYRNCALVVQARLCRYKYYRSVCCNSCSDALV